MIIICYRLFGAGMAANILQLTTRISSGAGAARFYISDEDPFRSNIRNDDEPYSDFLQVRTESVYGGLNHLINRLIRIYSSFSGCMHTNFIGCLHCFIEKFMMYC